MTPSIACDASDATPNRDKALLRPALLASRRAIAADSRRDWDAELGRRVIAWVASWRQQQPDDVLGVYWPIRGEPDLRPAYAELSASGVRLALPLVVDNHSPLRFIAWTPGDSMVQDSFGVAVPASAVSAAPSALLIPCVGFNRDRLRLGYGGGFYDRTLALAPRPQTIGIAYSCALAAFDGDPHDIALDAVITETERL